MRSKLSAVAFHSALSAIVLLTLTFVGVVYPVSRAGSAKPQTLTILYTNQESGRIRSCNCTKFRYGGYGRVATLVDRVRGVTRNLVIIQGGDMLGKRGVDLDRLKADAGIKCLNTIGYTAIIPGEVELEFGRPDLGKLEAASKAPFVLANANYKGTGAAIGTKPYVMYTTAGGVRVALIGLVSPGLLSKTGRAAAEVNVEDPVSAWKRISAKVRKSADVVFIIAHCTPDDARKLSLAGGADAVLCTHSADKLHMPERGANEVAVPGERSGSCVLVHSGSRYGWSVGRLDLELSGRKVTAFQNRLFYLDRAYAEDPKIVKLYDAYNGRVRELVLGKQQKLRSQFAELMKRRGIDMSKRALPQVFAGSDACKKCHEEAYSLWAASRHAKAFASLQKTKQGFDPECVGCHTTGAMMRGGFLNPEQTPQLTNVQCEGCHGPGISHGAKPAKGYGSIGEDTCRTCHTDDYNPDFDYDQMWKVVKH